MCQRPISCEDSELPNNARFTCMEIISDSNSQACGMTPIMYMYCIFNLNEHLYVTWVIIGKSQAIVQFYYSLKKLVVIMMWGTNAAACQNCNYIDYPNIIIILLIPYYYACKNWILQHQSWICIMENAKSCMCIYTTMHNRISMIGMLS